MGEERVRKRIYKIHIEHFTYEDFKKFVADLVEYLKEELDLDPRLVIDNDDEEYFRFKREEDAS